MKAAACFVFTLCLCWGQSPPPTFDAASVKPTQPVRDGSGRRSFAFASKDPGRVSYPNRTLRSLLVIAYNVDSFQIGGPDWLDTERFDIAATIPKGATKEQVGIMLQNLLTERFKMVVHRETKEMPVYSLVVAKNGLKIKESARQSAETVAAAPTPPSGAMKLDPDGFPMMNPLPGGPLMLLMMPGRARIAGSQNTIQDLAGRLTTTLGRQVTDATGLTGKYDMTLTCSTEGFAGLPTPTGAAADSTFVPEGVAPPDIFAAIQAQLGLRLEAKKGNVEMIVIDHAEKTPTAN